MGRAWNILGSAGAASVIAVSCTSGPVDATPSLEAGVAARVPAKHRPASGTCPETRGPGTLTAGCARDAGVPLPCSADSDCSAGRNGRCLPTPGIGCVPVCSYDTCQSDADCAGAACLCRSSGSAADANECAAGNCAVDADCGPSGYCSPTGLLTGCGIGYDCHTANDTCLDDADCASNQSCAFDPHLLAWACAVTCTLPP